MRLTGFVTAICVCSAVSVAAQQKPGITVERVAPNRWRATYDLAAPATALRFERPAAFFRERVWTVVTPGYRIVRRGELQIAALDSGATPRAEIVFEFPEFVDVLPKEYELFQPFTDGAVAIYTGHFYANPEGPGVRDTSSVRRLRVVPPAGSHAIVLGHVTKGVVTFTDPNGDGTYIYLGRARPIETPDVIALIDPGMPGWIKALFSAHTPELFHAYATRFGAKLPWKPIVLFSFHDDGSSGYTSGGGSLTGLLDMVLSGPAWRTESPAAAEQAFHLMAHESAHLWNGQLVKGDPNDRGAWMNEGGADAVANELLRDFAIIDGARYRARREDALNKCSSAVATGSVETALKRGAVREVYDCGFIMGIWTDAVVRRARSGADLFAFWRELIKAAQRHGGGYDEALYFTVLGTMGVPDSVVGPMRAFLANDSIQVAVAGLQQAGIQVRAGSGPPPAAYQQDAARAAMIHLMQQACGRVNFTSGAPMRTGVVANCAPFAAAMQVYLIQGLRVRDQGAAVHDAVAAACAANEGVALQAQDGATLATVPCTHPLAPRPAWFSIGPD